MLLGLPSSDVDGHDFEKLQTKSTRTCVCGLLLTRMDYHAFGKGKCT